MTGQASETKPAWFLTSAVVHQWQCDHFGHLNVRNYAGIVDDALFIFWSRVGFVHGAGHAPVTAELKLTFLHEVSAGAILDAFAEVKRIGTKSVTIAISLRDATSGEAMAASESVEVFFDTAHRRSMPIPEGIRGKIEHMTT